MYSLGSWAALKHVTVVASISRVFCVILQAAFNLLVCCYALGDKEGMMAAFQRLLTVPGLAEAKALQVGQHTQHYR